LRRETLITTSAYRALSTCTYHEMAQHYGIAVLAARPYKPRDKAKVENIPHDKLWS
jgi:transposase